MHARLIILHGFRNQLALVSHKAHTAAKFGEDLEGMMPMRSLAVGVLLRGAASEAALDTAGRSTCIPRR